MIETVFARMEKTQELMRRSVPIRANSTPGRLPWSLPGREWPQEETMTAQSALTAASNAGMLLGNRQAVVACRSIWEISDPCRV